MPLQLPEHLRDALSRARKRSTLTGGHSFELQAGDQHLLTELKSFFGQLGASVSGRFGQISERLGEWLRGQGVDMDRNRIDIRDKYK